MINVDLCAVQHCSEINMKEKFGKHSLLHLSLSLLVLGTKTFANFLQLIETIFHYEIKVKLMFSKKFDWVSGKIKMLFTSLQVVSYWAKLSPLS